MQKVMSAISLLESRLRTLSIWQSVVAGIFLVVMVAVDVVDVGGRYLFLHPFSGAYEVIALLLVLVGSWGMAFGEFNKSHIRVDLVTNKLSRGVLKYLDVLAYLCLVFVLVLVTWQTFVRAWEALFLGKGLKSEIIGLPYGPFYVIFGIGVGMFLIVALLYLIRLVITFRER